LSQIPANSTARGRFATAAITVAVVLLWVFSGSAMAQDEDCVGFLEQAIDPGGTNAVQSIYAVDLDGDGDVDVVSASAGDSKIAWFEHDGSTPPSFVEHTISTAASGAASVYAADVDGDGDVDVLSASTNDDKIAWYENSGTSPMVFYERTLTISANLALSVFAADVDGDGDTDVLSASFLDNRIAWFENRPSGETPFSPLFTAHTVSTSALGASGVHAADLDGDGDMDILAASLSDDTIAWYEVEPGAGEVLFEKHVISSTADGAKAVYAADVDDDGDVDVFSASVNDGKIAWYENDGNADPTFVERIVAEGVAGAKSVFVADVDGDDSADILAAGELANLIVWYEIVPGAGDEAPSFIDHTITSEAESVDAVVAADLSGDPTPEVLFGASVPGSPALGDEIAWFESDGATPPAYSKNTIATAAVGANFVLPIDFDGDGDADFLSAGDRRIAWHENTGTASRGTAGTSPPEFVEHVVSTEPDEANGIFAVDLDGDDDLDLIAAAAEDDRIAWYERNGTGFVEHLVSTSADSADAVAAADIDADGDVDILYASAAAGMVTLYASDLSGSRGAVLPGFTGRSLPAAGARSLVIEDLNGDGRLDFVVAAEEENKILWYENDGLTPPNFIERAVSADGASPGVRSVHVADLDGDGDPDVLSASSDDDTIAWYQNDQDGDDPAKRVFTERVISQVADFATSVFTADINGDDHIDVVSGSFSDNELAWYESDGEVPPTFTRHVVFNIAQGTLSVAAADFDGDEQPDLLAAYLFGTAWYEQLGETCGTFDATGDAHIDGAELAWLLKAFGRSVVAPETEWWAPLDFNQDQIIDGLDLAILGSLGVWGQSTSTCTYTCR
jgi:hypothetical protein